MLQTSRRASTGTCTTPSSRIDMLPPRGKTIKSYYEQEHFEPPISHPIQSRHFGKGNDGTVVKISVGNLLHVPLF